VQNPTGDKMPGGGGGEWGVRAKKKTGGGETEKKKQEKGKKKKKLRCKRWNFQRQCPELKCAEESAGKHGGKKRRGEKGSVHGKKNAAANQRTKSIGTQVQKLARGSSGKKKTLDTKRKNPERKKKKEKKIQTKKRKKKSSRRGVCSFAEAPYRSLGGGGVVEGGRE